MRRLGWVGWSILLRGYAFRFRGVAVSGSWGFSLAVSSFVAYGLSYSTSNSQRLPAIVRGFFGVLFDLCGFTQGAECQPATPLAQKVRTALATAPAYPGSSVTVQHPGAWSRTRQLWVVLMSSIPATCRFYVPAALGGDVFECSRPPATVTVNPRWQWHACHAPGPGDPHGGPHGEAPGMPWQQRG